MNLLNFIPKKKEYTLTEQKSDNASIRTSDAGTARAYRLDAIGQVCPFPLVEAKRAIEKIAPGDHLTIDFDCTQATDSIPAWAADQGHSVINFQQLDDAVWSITLQKHN